MSIIFKRAFSPATNIVLVAILLLVAIVALVYALDPKSLPISKTSNVASVAATQDKVIFNASTPFTCFDNASVAASAGETGGNAILVTTTKWAGAMLRFIDSCGGAVDFGAYSTLELHIKGQSTTPDPLGLYLYSYITSGTSAVAAVNPTSGWTTISVPISSLQNTWDLSNTQELRFKETANGSSYYIDSIVLKAAGTSGGGTTQPPAAPVVTISASPASITTGQSSTLTWSSTNSPTSCTASGGWTGSMASSNTQPVTPAVTTTYTLTCTNAGGTSAPANAVVTVGAAQAYQPITVLPWTPPASTPVPNTRTGFTLNWVGGANYSSTAQIPPPEKGGTWMVFVHLRNQTTGAYLKGADFYPSPAASAWSGNVSTAVSYNISPNTPFGTYDVIVGLYSGKERLPLSVQAPAVDAGGYSYKVGVLIIGTPTAASAPTISSITFPECVQNVYMCRQEIKGSNFAPTGNNVKVTNKTTGAVTSLGINGTSIGNMISGSGGTTIVVDVPSSLAVGTYDVTDTIMVSGVAKTSNAVPFTMLPITVLPSISAVTPTSGPYGTVVTITGTHFSTTNFVQIGPYYFNNVIPNANGALVVTMPATGYSSVLGTPQKVYVDNDQYGSSADNPANVAPTFTITGGTGTDRTAPVISAIASTTNATDATITWTTNETSDTQVFYGLTAPIPPAQYSNQTTLVSAGVTLHSVTVGGLAANTVYHFSVRSKDASGNLASSTDRTFTTRQANPTPPTAPTGVSATAVSSTQINLAWAAPLDVVSGYKVYRNGVLAGSTTTRAFTNTGLTPSTLYSYVVKADAGGVLSASSTAVTATTQAAPTLTLSVTRPTHGKVSSSGGSISCGSAAADTTCSTTSVTLNQSVTLTATPDSGYAVTGWTVAGCTSTATTCTFNLTGSMTVGVTFTSTSGDIDVSGGLKIWDGDSVLPADSSSRTVSGGTLVAGGLSGNAAQSATNDNWLNLAVTYPTDTSKYDKFVFYIKSNSTTGVSGITFYLGEFYGQAADASSLTLPGSYVNGGKIDTTWHQVAIPLSILNPNPQYITFRYTQGTVIAVDNFYLVSTNPAGPSTSQGAIKALDPLSSRVLKLSIDQAYALGSASALSNYTITSGGTTYSPVQVGRELRPTGFVGAKGGIAYGRTDLPPLSEGNMYLVFDRPFVEGTSYTLSTKNILNNTGVAIAIPDKTFTYTDRWVNGTVQVSQVGYTPPTTNREGATLPSPKVAYIGNYLGDAGYLDIAPTECKVVNASNDVTVMDHIPTTLKAVDAHVSGEKVYYCDFSTFNGVAGQTKYYIYVPGYGKSYDFDISPIVYNNVARTLARFFYLQRADMPIVAGQWSRPSGSLDTDTNALYHSTNYTSTYSGNAWDGCNSRAWPYTITNPFKDLLIDPAVDPQNATHPILGGWYDAGDYGKYVHPGRPAELMFAYELYPEKFQSDSNGLSNGESGDGIPDILNEIKWEIDFLKQMQYKDGAVFDRIEEVKPWAVDPYDTRPRYIYPRSTYTTGVFAAEMAQASRIFKANPAFMAKYPTSEMAGVSYADSLLVQAQKAWTFLQNNPNPLPSTEVGPKGVYIPGSPTCAGSPNGAMYPDGTDLVGWGGQSEYQSLSQNVNAKSDVDERAWAAAELYKTTGLSSYESAFKTFWSQTSPFYDSHNKQFNRNAQASLAYAFSGRTTDSTIIAKIESDWKLYVDDLYTQAMNNVYHNSYRQDVDNYIGWGNFAHAPKYSFDLITAYKLLGDSKYLTAAKYNLDIPLGANPQNRSYITGIGYNPPQQPLSMTSVWLKTRTDGVAPATEPMPGIPVYGPHNNMNMSNTAARVVQSDANIYPSILSNQYPMLRRYFDIGSLVEQSEYAMANIPPLLAAYAYFSN